MEDKQVGEIKKFSCGIIPWCFSQPKEDGIAR
jgi:hypothetical protein